MWARCAVCDSAMTLAFWSLALMTKPSKSSAPTDKSFACRSKVGRGPYAAAAKLTSVLQQFSPPPTIYGFSSLAGHINWVRSAVPSPDDRLIVSGSDDKTVSLPSIASKSFFFRPPLILSSSTTPGQVVGSVQQNERAYLLRASRHGQLRRFPSRWHMRCSGQHRCYSQGELNGIVLSCFFGAFLQLPSLRKLRLGLGHSHQQTFATLSSPR